MSSRRPAQAVVMAREDLPAKFRPGNQARLVRARATHETPSDPADFLPGLGAVQSGNGRSDLGMGRRGEQRRFNSMLTEVTEQRYEKARAAAIAPQKRKPGQARGLLVVLSWAGNSIFAERQAVVRAFQLQPVATWGTRQTYSTTKWGSDAARLKSDLDMQPIVSVFSIKPLVGRAKLLEHVSDTTATPWLFVSKIQRPIPEEFWVVTKRNNGVEEIYAATLYHTVGGEDKQVVRTDNLATEKAAQQYIKAYEVSRGDTGAVGHPHRVAFWNSIDRKTRPPGNPNLNGLGAVAPSPIAIAGLALVGAYLLIKNR